MIYATRFHDFSYGHRVVGHEGKCQYLHGHNGRIHFTVTAQHLDLVGRVLDFSVINTQLCEWLEDNWDHRMLMWDQDPIIKRLSDLDPSIVCLPFNPTAENMAQYLLAVVGPKQLDGDISLISVRVEETRKCSAFASISDVR